MITNTDKWSEWLLDKRFGGNKELYDQTMQMLVGIRDRVLGSAGIQAGDTVLDIGCGDGLLAMKAGELVGSSGRVIFSDISQACLDHCKHFSTPNSSFLCATADDLSELSDGSIDVVVLRSVLIYVADKSKALSEIWRVLKPGGRLSFFEPINVFSTQGDAATSPRMFGLDMSPIDAVAKKVLAAYMVKSAQSNTPMLDFDERDLLMKTTEAGFSKIEMVYEAEVDRTYKQPQYDSIADTAPNPNVPTLNELLSQVLSSEERRQFEEYVRPRLHLAPVTKRFASVYMKAVK